MEDDPYDQNDLRTAVTFGNSEVIGDWVGVQKRRGNRARVTRWVLFPAALYGQLDILKDYLQFGECHHVFFSLWSCEAIAGMLCMYSLMV